MGADPAGLTWFLVNTNHDGSPFCSSGMGFIHLGVNPPEADKTAGFLVSRSGFSLTLRKIAHL
jgi:hypothetical protein